MAGGAGTRFWPESRAARPKQLLPMLTGRSLLEATVGRLGDLVPLPRVRISTTAELAPAIAEHLTQLPREAILVEPCKRDTAPAIGLAAAALVREDPDAVMAILPSDQVIEPEADFRDALRLALELIGEEPARLVTFGIRPVYPAETFGYIERASRLKSAAAGRRPDWAAVYKAQKFHEKPKAEVARRYIRSRRFYWNSGMFVWRAQTILEALGRFQPEIRAGLDRIAQSAGRPDFDETLRREFSALPRISIDYAVMEHAEDVVMIEAPFRWDDLGSWRSLERRAQADESGNLFQAARSAAIDTSGTITRSTDPNHLIALLGVKDLVVVATPDATLVANKADEESIRRLIQQLEERGWREYL
jgi:mannose-1-phosphate guanylyltransferase